MPWGKKKRHQDMERALAEAMAQAGEMLDPYNDRTYVDKPGSDRMVVMEPGKMLDKLRERMERVLLDPQNIDIAVEDFLTFDEVALLVTTGLGGMLVEVTAEHAADLLARDSPPELATQPILAYDLRDDGLQISDEIQARARDILNGQTSQDRRHPSSEIAGQVSDLTQPDQINLYVAVLMLYLRKLIRLTSS